MYIYMYLHEDDRTQEESRIEHEELKTRNLFSSIKVQKTKWFFQWLLIKLWTSKNITRTTLILIQQSELWTLSIRMYNHEPHHPACGLLDATD